MILRKTFLPLLGAAVLVPWPPLHPARADDFTWRGDDGNNNWKNSGNWNQNPGGGDIPNDSTDNVLFKDGSSRYTVDLSGDTRTVNNFTISRTSDSTNNHTFKSGTVNLYGNLDVNVKNARPVFDSDFTLNIVNDVSGGIDANLNFTGTGDGPYATFQGNLAGESGTDINFTGHALFSGVNSFAGDIDVRSGTLGLANANVFNNAEITLAGGNLGLGYTGSVQIGLLTAGENQTIDLAGTSLYVGTQVSGSGTSLNELKANLTYDGFSSTGFGWIGNRSLSLTGRIDGLSFISSTGGGSLSLSGNDVDLSGSAVLNADGGKIDIRSGADVLLDAVGPAVGSTIKVFNGGQVVLTDGHLTAAQALGDSTGRIHLANAPTSGGYALTLGEIGGLGATWTYGGQFVGGAGFQKIGDGTMTLTGSSTSYTGQVDIQEGGLVLGSADALIASRVNLIAGTTLGLTTNSALGSLVGSGTANLGTHVLTVGGDDSGFTFAGNIAGDAPSVFRKVGQGTLRLDNVGAFGGTVRVEEGSLEMGAANALAQTTLEIGAGTDASTKDSDYRATYQIGVLKGSGSLDAEDNTIEVGALNTSTTFDGTVDGFRFAKTGTGVLTLTAPSHGVGTVRVDGGQIRLGNAGTLSNSLVQLETNDGLDFNGFGDVSVRMLSGSGNQNLGSTTLRISGRTGYHTYSGVLSGTGALYYDGSSGQRLYLDGANTFSGGLTVSGASVWLRNDGAAGDGKIFGDGGTVVYGDGLTVSNQIEVLNAITIEVGANEFATHTGLITGNDSANTITKTGSGTLELTANSSYFGQFIINGGTVLANNATYSPFGTPIGTAVAIVNGNGTLGGGGNAQAAEVHGTLSPGSSVGELTIGQLLLYEGARFVLELDDATGTAGTGWDLIDVNGNGLVLVDNVAGEFTIDLRSLAGDGSAGLASNFDPDSDYSWLFLQFNTIGGWDFDPAFFSIDTAGFENAFDGIFGVTRESDGLYLSYSAVPEPTTAALFLLGGIGLLTRRRHPSMI